MASVASSPPTSWHGPPSSFAQTVRGPSWSSSRSGTAASTPATTTTSRTAASSYASLAGSAGATARASSIQEGKITTPSKQEPAPPPSSFNLARRTSQRASSLLSGLSRRFSSGSIKSSLSRKSSNTAGDLERLRRPDRETNSATTLGTSPNQTTASEPYFTVHVRSKTSLLHSKLDLSLPSSTSLMDEGVTTPTTKELAASKGQLPHSPASPSGTLATVRTGALHQSAWSKPTSMFGNYSAGSQRSVSILSPSASSAARFDNSHLRLGDNLDILSHGQTLELYLRNAAKGEDPHAMYELAIFILEAAQVREDPSIQEHQKLVHGAMELLRKIAERGHVPAQFYLAECLAAGVGHPEGKPRMHQAHPLYILAAKHGHADAAYRAGRCFEQGWGCLKDNSKALNWLRKAGSAGHPGALYRLGMAELNGELGRRKDSRQGVKYLKLAATAATPEWPHALYELALLHNRGIEGVVFKDPNYACELLARAAELRHAPSAYLMGKNFEYGRMGCKVDGALSVHMYNIAAQQNHREACFAITAWYMVGIPDILPQSDTEAYLWAKKAAELNLAQAEFAMGYFCESGVGTEVDLPMARIWYERAIEHGDRRGVARLDALRASATTASSNHIRSSRDPHRHMTLTTPKFSPLPPIQLPSVGVGSPQEPPPLFTHSA